MMRSLPEPLRTLVANFGASAPRAWILEMTRSTNVNFFLCMAGFCLLNTARWGLSGSLPLAVVNGIAGMFCFAGLMVFRSERFLTPFVAELTQVGLVSLVSLLVNTSTALWLSDDLLLRQRILAGGVYFLKPLPLFLGVRAYPYIFYLVVDNATYVSCHWLSSELHGDPFTFGIVFYSLLVSLGYLGFAVFWQTRFLMLYQAQEEARVEREALRTLMASTTDALVWLAQDYHLLTKLLFTGRTLIYKQKYYERRSGRESCSGAS